MHKKYDIVASVGTYKNKSGETKNRYKNVGVVMEKDGRPFILLDRTFNPAGLQSDKDTVLLSLFEAKDKDSDYNNGLKHTQAKGNAYVADDLEDTIPWN